VVNGLVAMMHQVLLNLDPVYVANAILIQARLNNGEDVWHLEIIKLFNMKLNK